MLEFQVPSRLQSHPQNHYRAARRFALLTSRLQLSRLCQIDELEASEQGREANHDW